MAVPESFYVTFRYDGPRCPAGHDTQHASCRVIYRNTPGVIADRLQRRSRWPRWIRRHLVLTLYDKAGRVVHQYDLADVSELRIQPEREVIR